MYGLNEDWPRGPGTNLIYAGVLALAVAAVLAFVRGTATPNPYDPTATLTGRIMYSGHDRTGASVSLDSLPGPPPHPATEWIELQDPRLSQAVARLEAIPAGGTVTVSFGAFSRTIWRLDRADGGPGFGDAEITAWSNDAHRKGQRQALFFLAAGAAMLIAGIVQTVRDTGD